MKPFLKSLGAIALLGHQGTVMLPQAEHPSLCIDPRRFNYMEHFFLTRERIQKGASRCHESNEGRPGFRVEEVHAKAKPQFKLKPNVIFINAGTNDCTQQFDIPNIPQRMKGLVEDIFNNIPEVTVILPGLLPRTGNDACHKLINIEYGQVAADLAKQGRKIVFADTFNGYLTLDDLADEVHPNDHGYQKLTSIWWLAFTKAVEKGFITPPWTMACQIIQGTGIGPIQTQKGSGFHDGDYKHISVPIGDLFYFAEGMPGDENPNVFWADLDGDGYDEFIWYKDPVNHKGV
ncbi:hypothetical protein AJ79_03594 [Helicocarpus griseus UAMH5409]|uniref:SGNH hydrolase-type esterase domain-containing protein n=1 Tax=Helicocarpus griseus UAMH5409 TaxID=1447875 RepID=A0A2B7XXV1_9EURO|nr:hypothetical protein AJ79_03594 [Helicocarpus griseus UAMH5409]